MKGGGQQPEQALEGKEGKEGASPDGQEVGIRPGGAAAWEFEGEVGPRAGPAGPGFGSQWPEGK